MEKFTFCITSKNNKRYLQHAVSYIRENSAIEHDILVFVDADEDGTSTWCEENGVSYIKNATDSLYGIGNAYNLLVRESKTNFVVIYHADMIMGKGFDEHLYKLWKPKTVVSATRIEPPLHPADPAKIVRDFGLWPEVDVVDGFKAKAFADFVESNKSDKTTNGIFAPWLIHKEDFDAVGGHDPIMKSHSEDRDLFNRFLLNGYELVQSWGALVYHLTCRGGQFEHAKQTNDLMQKSADWQVLAHRQTREFVRKWGTQPLYDEYQHPIVPPKYNIAFVVHKCNYPMLEALEPWCDRLYIEDDMQVLSSHYQDKEQHNTDFDLTKRVFCIGYNDPHAENDIVVEFDITQMTQQTFNYITQLPQILQNSGEVGSFELDSLKINIYSMDEYQNQLICSSF